MIEQRILIRLNAKNKYRYCNCKVTLSIDPLKSLPRDSPEKKKEGSSEGISIIPESMNRNSLSDINISPGTPKSTVFSTAKVMIPYEERKTPEKVNRSQMLEQNSGDFDDGVDQIQQDETTHELMTYIFRENMHIVKKTKQKEIKKIAISDSQLADKLEQITLEIKGCRICEQIYEGSGYEHIEGKKHRKIREELQVLKEEDDMQFSLVVLRTEPGDISEEVQKEREETIRARYKKVKQQMITKSEIHEVAANQKKDIFLSNNKKRM